MRKNLLIALAVLTGMVISMSACILGENIETLEKMASEANLGDTVNIANIPGVTAPMNRGIPVTSIESPQYTGTVSWSPAPGASGFNYQTSYTATITLKAKKGYTLNLVKANFFKVAGATTVRNNANSGVVTAEFPQSAQGIINIAAIPGVTPPEAGDIPVTAIAGTEQYTGTVAWSPTVSGTFASSTIYTATITLTAKTGYTLQGVAANFFTVAGGSTPASNSANSGVITKVFSQTNVSVPTNRIEYYWVDQHGSLVTSSGGVTSISSGSTLTITPQGTTSYAINKWYVNGVDTGQNGSTYIFSNTTIGRHTVDLFLTKDNKLYNTSITITVTSNELTANTWTNGSITSSSDAQWFKFTATDYSQYIHASFGTLSSSNGFYVQVYDSAGSPVTSQTRLYSGNYTYVNFSATSGDVYYIKVTPYSSNYGTYQITFNTSSTPPLPSNSATAVMLTVGTWADSTISSTGEQWFKFTATANSYPYYQYIHASFGTLSSSNGFYVQVYESTGGIAASQTRLYSSNTYTYLSSVTNGDTYYIKVTPYNSYTGTYQIAFNTSSNPPLPSNVITTATPLTASTWADGNITSSSDVQWFKFTATSSTQYIHASFGTLSSSSGFYIQVYDSTGGIAASQTRLYNSNPYISPSVLNGQTYYIKVTPYSVYTGMYKIAFNTSSNPPLPNNIATTATTLTAGTWADGSITTSSNEQWLKFTATNSYQYIHAIFGTLSSSSGINVQVYNSTGGTVGSQTRLYYSNTYTYLSSVTSGQIYYIKVTPYNSYSTGTYQIAFNTSSTPPVNLPSNATTLTVNTWANGSIYSSNGEQWFKFTATADTQYIHVNLDTLNDLYVQVYNSSGSEVGSQSEFFYNGQYISRSVTSGQIYYIKVTPYYYNTGTYKIAFNTSPTRPN
ncbi:hypothetical protein [Treponema sp. R80B11-R83G3]